MALASEASYPPAVSTDFRPETIRGAAGFFRVGQDASGNWWLLDPDDRRFYCKAVEDVRVSPPPDSPDRVAPVGTTIAEVVARLREWGFNTVGTRGDGAGRAEGAPFLAGAEFCGAGPTIRGEGVRLPDVFDPAWPQVAFAQALADCAPLAGERGLVGWVADEQTAWGQSEAVRAGSPTLLQLCLSLEPTYAAYHSAWEFVLALHGGALESVARDWALPLRSREGVREYTRTEQSLSTPGYRRDHEAWTREFARRYYAQAAAAIRAADPVHLVLGGRFGGAVSSSTWSEAVLPVVDVAMADWRHLPETAGPVLASEVCWADEAFYGRGAAAGLAGEAGWLRNATAVERMLGRGRAGLERMARHPGIVGYIWQQWLDEPGEQPPFARGLVHLNGAEAREHTELLADFNRRAESVRCSPRPAESLLPACP